MANNKPVKRALTQFPRTWHPHNRVRPVMQPERWVTLEQVRELMNKKEKLPV